MGSRSRSEITKASEDDDRSHILWMESRVQIEEALATGDHAMVQMSENSHPTMLLHLEAEL
jgi:hypothetical protein